MEEFKMAEKLWDIANLVTGFAVAQVLVTTFALASHQLVAIAGRTAHWYAAVGTCVYTGFYLAAVIWCYQHGSNLSGANREIWCAVNAGRICAITLFTLALFFTLYQHRQDEINTERQRKTIAAPPSSMID